jgi:hypothetical protein
MQETGLAISRGLKAEFNRQCALFSQKYEFLHTFQTGRFLTVTPLFPQQTPGLHPVRFVETSHLRFYWTYSNDMLK